MEITPPFSAFHAAAAVWVIADQVADRNPLMAFHTCRTVAWASCQAFDQWPVTRSRATLKIPTMTSHAILITDVIPAMPMWMTPEIRSHAARAPDEINPHPARKMAVATAIMTLKIAVRTATAGLTTATVMAHSNLKMAVTVFQTARHTSSISLPWDFHQPSNPPVIALLIESNTWTTIPTSL